MEVRQEASLKSTLASVQAAERITQQEGLWLCVPVSKGSHSLQQVLKLSSISVGFKNACLGSGDGSLSKCLPHKHESLSSDALEPT